MPRFAALLTCLAGLAICPALLAQNNSAASLAADTEYGQARTTHEIMISGSGAANNQLDSSFGTVDFSYGSYFSTHSQWVIRQSLSYTNPNNAENGWSAATRLGYDYSISPDGTTRPFIGISGGRVYGDTVNDSWTAGLEAGAKFFVKPQTFFFALASYDWLFENGGQIGQQFEDGRFGWSLGVGYQF